jgi:mannose-6-phosphate isomerase-like protein (cupin superfamily)
MTYPEARYHGEGGEISAVVRPADRPPEVVYANGGTAHYLATGASTGGLFGLYRWEMSGARSGPDPHFHRTITESFYVLTGTIHIFDGREWRPCRPGEFVHVPMGGLHGFRNESGEPASMLIHFAPGAPREPYFEGIAAWPTSGRPGAAELADFYARHDTFWREDLG